MTATTRSAEDGTPDPSDETSQSNTPETNVADGLLVGMTSPDRCAECGAEMAVDQRYCVECGNRRGAARFTLARQSSKKGTAVVPQTSTGSRPPVVMLAATGIVIALLALGVGVLIGHDGKAKAVKVTVSGVAASSGGKISSGGGAKSGSANGSDTSTGTSKSNFFGG